MSFPNILLMGIGLSISFIHLNNSANMNDQKKQYGIIGQQAPELEVAQWVDGSGDPTDAIKLEQLKEKFAILYCFQAWCPGCHSRGLPALQKMTQALEGDDDVVFLAIQTVFEGSHANTYRRMLEIQKEYKLEIPFGHDAGDELSSHISKTMLRYRTGGTPWFIFIDKNNTVVFNDYHLDADKAIEYLNNLD